MKTKMRRYSDRNEAAKERQGEDTKLQMGSSSRMKESFGMGGVLK
jgi:hypothetical protein